MVCSADIATLSQIFERDRVVEFLAGLNSEFDQIRVQILGREKLPALHEVFAMVRSEENRRTAMLHEAGSERSAMISNRRAAVVTEIGSEKSAMVSNRGGGSRMKGGRGEFQSRAANKEALWCTFFNKPRHTRETCFKLHGKEVVLNRLGSFKNLAAKNQAYVCSKGQEEEGLTNQSEPAPGADFLNTEEISKLKLFLKTLQDGACSLAHKDSSGHDNREDD
ncbi:uncharacterized protein LOC127787025 [Diospyros lotus]|uniref:uncharacterized protein LOC127787025 n=1 Tax=Diospyros lotus TaxID=55363 RepID=UPI002250412D|nr:uncharacterized protein LOC127787025 [Diospyros lotus]